MIVQSGEVVLSRFRALSRIALVGAAVLAATVAGCKNSAQVFENNNEGGWFSKKVDIFAKPEWAVVGDAKTASLGPSGPVDANDLVGADGRCGVAAPAAPEPAPAAAPTPPADRAVGSMAGDLAGAPMPAAMPVSAYPNDSTLGGADANAPQVMGGIALGMTECQAVQRAGLPGNIAISAGEKGERKVVLTYLTGVWPGIYHFSDGRLKEIDRAPAPPESVKPVKKQKAKKPVKPKTATHQTLQRTSTQ
jgi:hypothetical protein